MKQKIKSPYFEVDFKERLEQQRTAINAVRFPRLGFRQYQVYDIVEKKDKDALNSLYGKQQVTRPLAYHVWTVFLDEVLQPPYKLKWLKPKHVTFLQLQGHRVEEVK